MCSFIYPSSLYPVLNGHFWEIQTSPDSRPAIRLALPSEHLVFHLYTSTFHNSFAIHVQCNLALLTLTILWRWRFMFPYCQQTIAMPFVHCLRWSQYGNVSFYLPTYHNHKVTFAEQSCVPRVCWDSLIEDSNPCPALCICLDYTVVWPQQPEPFSMYLRH